jgi:acyl-CoA synthetase (AMP-forming)/AMP-acid ligase II
MKYKGWKMEDQKIIGIVAINSVSFIEAVFDCYKKKQVVVLLRDTDDSRIETTNVSNVLEPDDAKGWFRKSFNFSDDDSLAQISFTSGTEGEPKGVLLTHRALSDVTQRLNVVMEVDSSIREYIGVPANYSFGLGRFRAVAAAGGHSYLPEFGFNPVEIKQMLNDCDINAVSAVPSLWRVLLKNKSIFGDEALNLKWVEIGSQYMCRLEKEELKLLFPNAIIVQHYGLTEASRTTFLRVDQVDGEVLESVGVWFKPTDIKISDSGCICIKGPHVAKSLLIAADYVSNVDDEGWFETSDLGYIENASLYYQGRADDLINCGGVKLSPDALERDIGALLNLKDGLAISCIDDELVGNGILIASLESLNICQDDLIAAASDVLSKYGVNNKNIVRTMVLDDFPVGATGKIQRKKLAAAYNELSRGLELNTGVDSSQQIDKKALTKEEKKILTIWHKVLKVDNLDIDASFYELGGDSLTAIGALVEMERSGVSSDISKGMLQGFTIREIAAQLSLTDSKKESIKHKIKTPALRFNMVISMIRGIMVLFVIAAHWYQGVMERVAIEYLPITQAIFQPFFSMGTPGFAIIYGIGAGYSLYPVFLKEPARVKIILKKTFLFLFLGIVSLALVRVLHNYLVLEHVSFTDITNTFYSVLMYYLLITATLYFWFKLISASKHTVGICFALAIVMYSMHILVVNNLPYYKTEGLVELLKLLLTAKYAYFLMLSGTLAGVGVGVLCRRFLVEKESFSSFYIIGMACVFLGGIISFHIMGGESWLQPVKTNYIWRWITYFGVVLILIASVESMLIRYSRYGKWKRGSMQFLSVMGLLAFPLFVSHEMVIPMKNIILSMTGHESFSLLFSISCFLIVTLIMFRKVYLFSFVR